MNERQRTLLNTAWYKGDHPCRLRDFLVGCHCEDCIKIYHPEDKDNE